MENPLLYLVDPKFLGSIPQISHSDPHLGNVELHSYPYQQRLLAIYTNQIFSLKVCNKMKQITGLWVLPLNYGMDLWVDTLRSSGQTYCSY